MNCISKKVRTVALVTNTAKDKDFALFLKVLGIISGRAEQIRVPLEYKDELGDMDGVVYMERAQMYSGADAAIVLGGDGTILRAASLAIKEDCAILGINLGRIGYMAEVGKDECEKITRLFDGLYRTSERMTLKVSVVQGGETYTVCENALNDVVIRSVRIGKVLGLNAYFDGVLVSEHRGDGLIVSTPTGSTAYSISAGGPVLDPSLECLCITPVCSLSPAARSIVFSAGGEIEVAATYDNRDGICISCDGEDGKMLDRDARIVISRAEKKARLISLGEEEFFNVLRKKTMSAM